MQRLAVASIIAYQSVSAQTDQEKADYARFSQVMDTYKLSWEPVKVTTEDDYILTLFHITVNADGNYTPSKGPVLIQNGDQDDGTSWLAGQEDYSEGVPMHLQLAMAGYDVWISSNRGTEYSLGHKTLTTDDPEYWAFSWAEFGRYDQVANLKAIKEATGQKAYYIGYSQGTIQMFYGLAHKEEEFYADHLHKVLLMAPCTQYNVAEVPESYYLRTLFQLPTIGIHHLFGTDYADNYEKICTELGEEACELFSCQECQGVSVQAQMHWIQGAFTGRFQEYAPDYLEGTRETDLVPLETINKVPIAMFVATNDESCTLAQAQEDAEILGDIVTNFETFEGDHLYFWLRNDKEYMDLLFSSLEVAAPAEQEDYPRFAQAMEYYGFTWESKEVTTEDGYILTLFHVTGNADGEFTPSKAPVLIQNGDMDDGASWVGGYAEGVPMHLQLAEAGYDVWISNNRGTEYSLGHETLTTDDPEYWAFSWAEFGRYDQVANLKKIKEETGKKAFYVGYSQGTIQMFYGLAHKEEEFYADHLHKAVLLAPCTLFGEVGPESYYENTLYQLPSIGVHHLYGSDYATNYYKICTELGADTCQLLGCQECQGVSVQAQLHWMYNAYTGRFQEYAPKYQEGERETDLIPLASINQVPIAMFVGAEDQTCTLAQAQETAAILGDTVTRFEIFEGGDHLYFWQRNDKEYMDLLISQLEVEAPVGTGQIQDSGATATTTMAAVLTAAIALLSW